MNQQSSNTVLLLRKCLHFRHDILRATSAKTTVPLATYPESPETVFNG